MLSADHPGRSRGSREAGNEAPSSLRSERDHCSKEPAAVSSEIDSGLPGRYRNIVFCILHFFLLSIQSADVLSSDALITVRLYGNHTSRKARCVVSSVLGIHHVTAIAGDPQQTLDFYTEVLGLRLVKVTVD